MMRGGVCVVFLLGQRTPPLLGLKTLVISCGSSYPHAYMKPMIRVVKVGLGCAVGLGLSVHVSFAQIRPINWDGSDPTTAADLGRIPRLSFSRNIHNVAVQKQALPQAVNSAAMEVLITGIFEEPEHSGFILLPCSFDGVEDHCVLDTGSNTSLVEDSSFFQGYVPIGTTNLTGLGCTPQTLDKILIHTAEIGPIRLNQFVVFRWKKRSYIGRDALTGRVLRFTFRGSPSSLSVDDAATERARYPLEYSPVGAYVMPVMIGQNKVKAMFDTGVAVTLVDRSFVSKHSEQFVEIKPPENAMDGSGAQIQWALYQMKSITIGNRTWRDQHVYVMDLDSCPKMQMSDTPVILGFNLITQMNWTINLKDNKWDAE